MSDIKVNQLTNANRLYGQYDVNKHHKKTRSLRRMNLKNLPTRRSAPDSMTSPYIGNLKEGRKKNKLDATKIPPVRHAPSYNNYLGGKAAPLCI